VNLWLDNRELDVIHTKRSSRAGESGIKLFITRIGYAILHKVSHISIQPEVGDFKLLSSRAVNQLVRFRENKPFTRGLVNWIGFNQTTITYQRKERFAGETKFPIFSWGVISNFLDSALISFSDVPLKISLLVGFLVSFGAFGYLIIIFFMKYMHWSVPGWAAIMATMLMLGGIQLFTLGMLGLYINSIFIEAKRRPNYIIESTFGFDRRLPSQGDTE
jgi:dolichol-phosphate mannosyltransferase